MMDTATIQKALEQKIKVIKIIVEDDSDRHKNHKQSQGKGGHFNLLIVSNDFEGMKLIERHRKIYDAIEMNKSFGIHALSIDAWTEREWKEKNVSSS